MIGFPSNTCLAILVLSTLELCVVSQDFCESYKKSDYSMIIWSHSNDSFLLIIDKHFWRLWEVDSKLVFDRIDFQASNSSDQWTENNYTFAHVVYDLNETKYRGIALVKDMNRIDERDSRLYRRDYYDFHGNHFSGVKQQETKPYISLHQKRFSFYIPEEHLEYEIIQYYTQKPKQLVRMNKTRQAKREYAGKGKYNYTFYYYLNPSQNDGIHSQVERLYNFTDIPMIGTYLSSEKKIICFFRIEDDIKYCTIDECIREEYKILISCGETKPIIWILLAIAVVTIVVLVTIAAIVVYLMKGSKPKKVIYELQSASTVNTINSETGQFVDPSKPKRPSKKERMGGQSRKSVSPQKLQKPSSPAKGKAKMKPKKSPQLKK